MPFTHAIIDKEIQRIISQEDISADEKSSRIETWEKMRVHAVADGNPPKYRTRKPTLRRP